MKKNFWSDTQNDLVKQYIITKDNKHLSQLVPSLEKIAGACLYKLNQEQTEDIIQDCVINMISEILPKITEDKSNKSFNFLFIGTKWYLMVEYRKKNLKRIPINDEMVENTFLIYDESDNADYSMYTEDLRNKIIMELDKKIYKLVHGSYNPKSQIEFLNNLKTFIIENNYDVREFKKWIMEKSGITPQRYYQLFQSVDINPEIFNERLMVDNKTRERRKYQAKSKRVKARRLKQVKEKITKERKPKVYVYKNKKNGNEKVTDKNAIEKHCSKCGKVLPIENFSWLESDKRYMSQCKECRNETNRNKRKLKNILAFQD
jgi:hypothetical protein